MIYRDKHIVYFLYCECIEMAESQKLVQGSVVSSFVEESSQGGRGTLWDSSCVLFHFPSLAVHNEPAHIHALVQYYMYTRDRVHFKPYFE